MSNSLFRPRNAGPMGCTGLAHRRAFAACLLGLCAATPIVVAQPGCITVSWVPGAGGVGTNGNVRALLPIPSGDVLVGGTFGTAGTISASNLARYNPTSNSWTNIGNVGGNVEAMHLVADGTVIVAGAFATAGGITANDLARYNPATGIWSNISPTTQTDGIVIAIQTLSDGDILAGGFFTSMAGLSSTAYLARFDSATGNWTSVGAFNSIVYDLLPLPDGTIAVGGSFTMINGISRPRLAKYHPDTNSWSAIGGGIGGGVNAMTLLPNGDVVIGGSFTTDVTGTIPFRRIVRYRPSTDQFYDFGDGFNQQILSLATLPDGDVLVGGLFTPLGLVTSPRIARLHATTGSPYYSPIPGGTDSGVLAIAPFSNGDVYIGGTFNFAGGGSSNYFAKFQFSATAPSFTQHPANITVCPGEPASFSVAATGTGSLAYAWSHNALPISPALNPSAATPTLVVSNVSAAELGTYSCTVTDSCTSTTSNSASLSFISATCSTPFPSCPSNSVSFNLSYSAPTTPTAYQWRRDGVNLTNGGRFSGVTGPSLSITSLSISDAGSYDCIVSTNCGTLDSSDAPLSIAGLTANPLSQNACEGTTVAFSVQTSGNPDLRWFKNGIMISGNPTASTSTLILTNVSGTDAANYTCRTQANGCGGPLFSNPASLTLLAPSDPACGGPSCNPDYNQDGGGDTSDVIDLTNDIAMGTESFPPNTTDFNQDGGGDTSDVIDLANTIASGECP